MRRTLPALDAFEVREEALRSAAATVSVALAEPQRVVQEPTRAAGIDDEAGA